MTDTTSAEFYDTAMVAEGSPAMLELADSPWLLLYREAARMILPHEHVVDLGCGTGRFIHQLIEQNHYAPITGLDFSRAALEEASSYLGQIKSTAPIDLVHADLRNFQPDADRAGNTVYTCLEVLEHLEDDRDLVRTLPAGHRLIASLPNYESDSHVRCMRDVGDLWARYDDLLTFNRWCLIRIDERKHIHLIDTTRRPDSW